MFNHGRAEALAWAQEAGFAAAKGRSVEGFSSGGGELKSQG
jgi:hypothetical protein